MYKYLDNRYPNHNTLNDSNLDPINWVILMFGSEFGGLYCDWCADRFGCLIIVDANKYGSELWYKDGKLHRDNDLPAITHTDSRKGWYQNGLLHRDGDLPAITSDNSSRWYKDGELHRDNDLPAIIDSYGNREYWVRGNLYIPNE